MLSQQKEKEILLLANNIRQTIIEMLTAAGSGHTAGPLGMADIFAAFYFYILHHDPHNPGLVRYAAMAHAGYFPVEECLTLRKFGSRLQGHPERLRLPGLETTSGPLGLGLSQAAGYAYAARMDSQTFRTYCVMSDGEQDAGNTWEAAMFAGNNKLANLTAIIDRNNIQINGTTEDIMPLENLRAKYEAFNWHVLEVDGHNVQAFVGAVDEAKAIFEKPTVIIAHTIPGKGIKEIEFDYRWHGSPPGKGPTDKIPADKQTSVFLQELRTLQGKIVSEHE